MSLTTHVLDTARGRPAAGVRVEVSAMPMGSGEDGEGPGWLPLPSAVTDQDGRARLTDEGVVPAASYHLRFHVSNAADVGGAASFYPWVDVTVRTHEVPALHVPLLLSPFGYTTYRGS